MPRTRAIDSEMKSTFVSVLLPYLAPGSSSLSPSGLLSAAAPITFDRENPYLLSTQKVISAAPEMSRTALMICTQVVPFMPPTST